MSTGGDLENRFSRKNMSELFGNTSAEIVRHPTSLGVTARRAHRILRSLPSCTGERYPEFSLVDLGRSKRLAVMITPESIGSFQEQASRTFSTLKSAMAKASGGMNVTTQTVFLRDSGMQADWEMASREFYRGDLPVTNVVYQAPCNGAELALEAWAIGGDAVQLRRPMRNATTLDYDGVRWVYCGGIQPSGGRGVYDRTINSLEKVRAALRGAGSDFQHVVRTWFYLGGITEREGRAQRYMELNRARTDYYHEIPFGCSLLDPNSPRGVFPASTGIGTAGHDLLLSCLALQTDRKDVFLLPLENPQQTPAYAYHPKYSPKSPKFSRAMALFLGDCITTWISGTASIVDSESRHLGDIVGQTEQTIDNIERLIASENFALHGVAGAGATLQDLAKVRVYLKHKKDYEACKAVCQRRFGPVPAIYAIADVCRPELLVEIEGVAFSRRNAPPRRKV